MNNFLCVKSLITIALVGTFCVLTVCNPQEYGETMKNIVVTVVSFYFGTQFQKSQKDGDKK